MKLMVILGAVLLSVSMGVSQGLAVPIGLADFSGAETLFDFENKPVDASFVGPFSESGVTVSETSSGSGSSGGLVFREHFLSSGSIALTDKRGVSDLLISFDAPQHRVGLDVGHSYRITSPAEYRVSFFTNNSTLLGQVTGTALSFFAGWQDAAGILQVRVEELSGENGQAAGIDNLRFGGSVAPAAVPEPATWLLLGAGMVGLGAVRFRSRK